MTAIDLFAGAGGFTLGAEAAGVRVVWAGNHWPVAVETHATNHPSAVHLCQDLHQANWAAVPPHDVLLASPCCQGHTRARGSDRPHHDASRSTAWAVVSAAEFHRPALLVVENVPEFRDWVLFGAWRQALEALGYALAFHVLDAADFGVPQNRVRLFIVGARGGSAPALTFAPTPHVAAESIIDWATAPETPVRNLCPATRRRVRGGRVHGDRFVLPYYSSARGGRSLARPLGTVTTLDRWALVDGNRLRMLTVGEYRAAMGFPPGYKLPATRRTAIQLLGNAVVPPVATAILRALQGGAA